MKAARPSRIARRRIRFSAADCFVCAIRAIRKRPVEVGLGTDIGAGTSFSLLATMGEAYKVSQLAQAPIDAVEAFYLATLGGARALDLGGRIGIARTGA